MPIYWFGSNHLFSLWTCLFEWLPGRAGPSGWQRHWKLPDRRSSSLLLFFVTPSAAFTLGWNKSSHFSKCDWLELFTQSHFQYSSVTLQFFFCIHFFPRSLLLLSKLCRTSLQSSDSCFHFLVVSIVTQVLWRFLFFVCVAWKDGASRENVRFCAGAFFSAWKRLCLLLAVYFSSCKLNFHTLTTKSANFPQSPSVTSTFRNVLKHESLENSPLVMSQRVKLLHRHLSQVSGHTLVPLPCFLFKAC